MTLARLALLLPILLICEQPAEAYVDPGAASYVFQLIVGGSLGFLYVMRTHWRGLVGFVRTRILPSRHAGH